MLHITGGKITFGRTVKTGDYENKRADVEIHFSVPEDDDVSYEEIIALAGEVAHKQAHRILGIKEPELATKALPAPKTAKAPVEVEDVPEAEPPRVAEEAPAKRGPGRPPKRRPTPAEPEQVPMEAATEPAPEMAEDDWDTVEETPSADITDEDLHQACQKRNEVIKNGVAIRQLVGKFAGSGGRLPQIPQAKRSEFLDALQAL